MLGRLFGKGVPAYLWIAIFYIVYVGVIAAPEVFGDIVGSEDAAADTTTITEKVEQVLSEQLFAITLFSGQAFAVTWTTIFIILGFLASWIEVMRATKARDFSGNDWMSLIVTVGALLLFVGVGWFGTTAFMIVPLVGIGDLLLDRYVGQAVARRDFGVPFGADGGS
ncbi:MAG: hypothetical protein AAF661_00995 [Pseudomonadota bacterium]